MFEQSLQGTLALTTDNGKMTMDKETTFNRIKTTTINQTQIMRVGSGTILEPVIRKEAFLKGENLGTLIESKRTIGLDREIEKKEKLSRLSQKIGTSILQTTDRVIQGSN